MRKTFLLIVSILVASCSESGFSDSSIEKFQPGFLSLSPKTIQYKKISEKEVLRGCIGAANSLSYLSREIDSFNENNDPYLDIIDKISKTSVSHNNSHVMFLKRNKEENENSTAFSTYGEEVLSFMNFCGIGMIDLNTQKFDNLLALN